MKEKDKFIRKKSDYDRIFKEGKRIYNPYFSILFTKADLNSRLGIILSKKTGNAVKRNLIKRRIRHIWKMVEPVLEYKADFLIIPKPNIIQISFNEMKNEIQRKFLKVYIENYTSI
ncbi:MAG: ribonuclease P protein component [Candidatus Coatesbacteria bacterium]|nr:ribonuclease P protein component [Candidatus Coatesbacteria bacterium]